MSANPVTTQAQIDAAERDVQRADRRLEQTTARLKTHASKVSSYSAPLAVAGGLMALRILKRSFRRRKDAKSSASGATPARAGLAALLLRMGLPAMVGFARQQADRFGSPGQDARDVLPPPRVSAALDPVRFSGRWYEVACLKPLDDTAGALLDGEEMSVVLVPDASGFEVEVTTRHEIPGSAPGSAPGRRRRRVRHGRLRTDDPAQPAQLVITFAPPWLHWLPAVWGDYWVLAIGRNYDFALVGDKDRTDLRVLSRVSAIDPTVYDQLMRTAREDGYAVDRMSIRKPFGAGPGAASAAPPAGTADAAHSPRPPSAEPGTPRIRTAG